MRKLSILVPCYNEESCIGPFLLELSTVALEIPYEVIFVDDGSDDGTLAAIKAAAVGDANVHYVSFSRNFGKESALLAGLRKATGDYVVTMDVDLQDPPSYLPQLLAAIEEGYDCAATHRVSREGEPPIRSWFARMFYWLMRKFSDVELVDGARDYRMMRRRVVDAILSMPENNRFTKGIYQWVGFRTKWIAYENVARVAGETKWSFFGLLRYAMNGIIAFSTAPLMAASWIGVCACLVSFVSLMWIFTKALIFGNPVAGWPSMVCIITFFGGIQLCMIGIIGIYLAKVYLETKRRPMYFVAEEA